MSKHTISGKFFIKDKKHYYTNQQDLASGWRIVLPSSNFVIKSTEEIKNNEGDVFKKHKYKNDIIYNEVTLAQLPSYLHRRLKNDYNPENEDIVYDKFFKFRVIKTAYDDMIKELYKLVEIKYPNQEIRNKIKDLTNILESNGISGWLIIRAKHKSF
jgi:hypothetical protein